MLDINKNSEDSKDCQIDIVNQKLDKINERLEEISGKIIYRLNCISSLANRNRNQCNQICSRLDRIEWTRKTTNLSTDVEGKTWPRVEAVEFSPIGTYNSDHHEDAEIETIVDDSPQIMTDVVLNPELDQKP